MLEEGEVSRDLELSIQESESDILAPCGDKGSPWWRAKLPFPANLSETRRGEDTGCSLDSDIIPDRLSYTSSKWLFLLCRESVDIWQMCPFGRNIWDLYLPFLHLHVRIIYLESRRSLFRESRRPHGIAYLGSTNVSRTKNNFCFFDW